MFSRSGARVNNVHVRPSSPCLRYLLVELSFGSVEEGCQALRPATPKSLVQLVREAVLALHGDYGLACVKQSLNGIGNPL